MANDAADAIRAIGPTDYKADDGGLWLFNETAGATTANDTLRTGDDPTGNHAAVTGGVTFGVTGGLTGSTDTCATFDGTGYLTTSTAANLARAHTAKHCVIVLFKYPAALRSGGVANYDFGGNRSASPNFTGSSFGIEWNGSSKMYLFGTEVPDLNGTGAGYIERLGTSVGTPNDISADTWHTAIKVWGGSQSSGGDSAAEMRFFLDGVETSYTNRTATLTDTDTATVSTQAYRIGSIGTVANLWQGQQAFHANLPHGLTDKEIARVHSLLTNAAQTWVEHVNGDSFYNWIRTHNVIALGFGDSRTNGEDQSWWNNFCIRGVIAGVVPARLGEFKHPASVATQAHLTTVEHYDANWRQDATGGANLPAPFEWANNPGVGEEDEGIPEGKGFPVSVFTHDGTNQSANALDLTFADTYGNVMTAALWPNSPYASVVFFGGVGGLSQKRGRLTIASQSIDTDSGNILGVDEVGLLMATDPATPDGTGANAVITIRSSGDVDESGKLFAVVGAFLCESGDGQSAIASQENGMTQLWSIAENGWMVTAHHHENDYYYLSPNKILNVVSAGIGVEIEGTDPDVLHVIDRAWLFVLQCDVNDAAAAISAADFIDGVELWEARVRAFCATAGITEFRLCYIHSWWPTASAATYAIWEGYWTEAQAWAAGAGDRVAVSTSARYKGMVPRQLLREDGGVPVHLKIDTAGGLFSRHDPVDKFWDIIYDAGQTLTPSSPGTGSRFVSHMMMMGLHDRRVRANRR